jgi:predicted nucleic acid-binding protein
MGAKRSRPDRNADKYLLFIDTNIWLDFYRRDVKGSADGLLPLIDSARGRIIVTDQVKMEFMKNRQNTIVEVLERPIPRRA